MSEYNCERRIAIIGMTKNNGGIESVIMNVYRNIDKSKVQFDFILLHDAEKMAYEDEVIAMGARVFRIMYAQRESLKLAKKTLLDFFKEHREIKGVYLHTNYPYAFPLKVAKQAGVPIRIIHAHNSVKLFENLSGMEKIKRSLLDTIIYRQVKKYPNCYLSCSDLAAKSTFKTDKYIWIKNGIEINKFAFNSTIRNRLRNEYKIKDDEKVVGVIGVLDDRKNPLFALEVFKKYVEKEQNSRLIFVGDGVLKEKIYEKIKDYNLEDRVILTGMISDTYKWYQAMDMLLLPSLYEGFPMVLVEGQAAGVSCLISDTVTKQVAVTDLLHYKSNLDNADEWADELLVIGKQVREREQYSKIMFDKGFDVSSMVKEISQILTGA